MAFYNWDNSPSSTKQQINRFIKLVTEQLTGNLIGIYLHGSLTMKCFNPEKSDIDLIVVTTEQMDISTKKKIIEELLVLSNNPHPIEVSFIINDDLKEWKYPTPFDLHYSEDWRNKYKKELIFEKWKEWNNKKETDVDLAAHITIILQRGITLYGEAINTVFPDVPKEDYKDSILLDFKYALEGILQKPIYGILNSCRIYAYLTDYHIFSKQEAGMWAIEQLPGKYKELIKDTLEIYESDINVTLDQQLVLNFKEFIKKEVSKFIQR
ncbi:hypothetical protein BHF71_10840 [Vulcanibacillus modesticaldus]|uniref:Spectinomycin 9-adenylyltransferase n=1 Tax=Vulcanibacillus modesticaldus TaxID=337097 RepID=A0A1D2YT18_9BACI|nr:aminoglycoside adenylyltransferase domain-containing protein [Vulcanibacillus modesticaldus]OEF98815.1 hypothetical protein BHF71_10840 [Vulcanibacillus modesticaldus]